jgi:hypothetical protein
VAQSGWEWCETLQSGSRVVLKRFREAVERGLERLQKVTEKSKRGHRGPRRPREAAEGEREITERSREDAERWQQRGHRKTAERTQRG